ncbi:MAG: hypothetical protein WBW31_01190 [Candidatus Sulfotelmatobacter sp.]
MPSQTFSEWWEAFRPRFLNGLRSWRWTPERSHSLVLLLWPIAAVVIAVLVIRRASTAKELADLISAIASLAWPVVTVAIVNWFRPEIRDVLSRIRKGKFLGQEIELDELQAKTVAAEAKVELRAESELRADAEVKPWSAPGEPSDVVAPDMAQDAIEEVLREASRSPRLGLMLLSAKMERAARELAADIGLDVSRRPVALNALIRALVQAEQLPFEAAEALNLFIQVRNRIVHGHDANEDEIARAIDSGTRLLKLLLSSYRPPHQTDAPGD